MYTITITKEELNALVQSLDSALRYDWIKSIQWINHLLWKIQSATIIAEETK